MCVEGVQGVCVGVCVQGVVCLQVVCTKGVCEGVCVQGYVRVCKGV